MQRWQRFSGAPAAPGNRGVRFGVAQALPPFARLRLWIQSWISKCLQLGLFIPSLSSGGNVQSRMYAYGVIRDSDVSRMTSAIGRIRSSVRALSSNLRQGA